MTPPISQERLSSVTAWFQENFSARGDLGASVSIWQGGREILSLYGGYCDRSQSRPWTQDTLVPVWSATKGPAAVCCLLALHEAGIHLQRRVAEVWPEFAGGGKESVTFAQLLSHTAGLCALDDSVPILDYAAVIEALEAQRPLWDPGTRQGYHARTFGFLLEEIVRRVSRAESLGAYFRDRFQDPLELDFWIGLPAEKWERVSPIYPGKLGPGAKEQPFLKAFMTAGTVTQRTFTSPMGLNAVSDFNQPDTWAQGFASMGGVGSARGLAKLYAILAQGGRWEGKEIVPESLVRQLEQTLSNRDDDVLCAPAAFAAGVMHDPVDAAGAKLRQHFGPNLRAFGHPGAGGSLAFADPETGVSFAYVMNQMEPGALPGPKGVGLVERLFGEPLIS